MTSTGSANIGGGCLEWEREGEGGAFTFLGFDPDFTVVEIDYGFGDV